jgi:phosphoribosylaminoimidazole-succinocarboxamide synthase
MSTIATRRGSSKDVTVIRVDNKTEIDLGFTKRFSVFDVGPVPYEIDGMDVLRHAIAVRSFQELHEHGVPTHFIRSDSKTLTITVEAMNIYEVPGCMFSSARGKIIPLEIIDRQELTQPLIDRMPTNPELSEKVMARVTEPVAGNRFSLPLVECTTKFEPIDRRLLDAEAIALAKLGECSYRDLCAFVQNASNVLTRFFDHHGFKRLDGKWEIAITYDGPSFVVVDSYSPDEMRLIGADGRSYDKDPLRNWYKNTFPGWIKDLDACKREWPDNKDRWPAYPAEEPPQDVLNDLVGRYASVAKAIGAI